MLDEDTLALLPTFLEESRELITSIQDTLLRFWEFPDCKDTLNQLFRWVHTIKGNCGPFPLDEARQLAHHFETELNQIKNDPKKITIELIEQWKGHVDKIEDMIFNAPSLTSSASAKMASHGSESENPSPAEKVKNNETSSFLKVSFPLVTNALNVVWEIFLIRNQMEYLIENQIKRQGSIEDLRQEWEGLDASMRRNIYELESNLMGMRLTPAKGLFSRMSKVVRSYLSEHPEKDIVLETIGDDVEIDKKVADMLGEPLIHLIRNAMDHGIEDKTTRKNNGKNQVGKIQIVAKSNADLVEIAIIDDGKGLDPDKILLKAREKGIDTSQISDDKSAIELIFAPGFSTAEALTDVSGRGVGMDAVSRSIKEVNGAIDIESKLGFGSTFYLRIPQSLAVLPSLTFSVNGQTYASSVKNIIEVCRFSDNSITNNGADEFIKYRDQYIATYNLQGYLFKNSGPTKENSYNDDEGNPYIIAEVSDHSLIAFRVDQVFGESELVVKAAPPLLPMREFLSGVSILPTGEAIFMLSFRAVAKLCQRQARGGTKVYEAA
jgi:two-component system chemotaxis sensor kinase CheA